MAALPRAEPVSKWVGYWDVLVAAGLFAVTFWIEFNIRKRIHPDAILVSYRVYRGGASLLLVLLSIFLVIGDRVEWNILLSGLAWRTWLLVYALPAGVTAWKIDVLVRGNSARKGSA